MLVLDKEGTLCVEADIALPSTEVIHHREITSIDLKPDAFPCTIINYVARTREPVVNELGPISEAVDDAYHKSRKPKSILSIPLLNQSQLIGILYLENNHTTHAFTPDGLELFTLLSGQSAAALEKARLLQDLEAANASLQQSTNEAVEHNRTLEAKVQQRTVELREKNDHLEVQILANEEARREMRLAKEEAEGATQLKSLLYEFVQF